MRRGVLVPALAVAVVLGAAFIGGVSNGQVWSMLLRSVLGAL